MYRKIVIVGMSLIIVLIGLFTAFDKKTISYLERRNLARFPKVELFEPSFYSELDDYLSDHIVFRDELIKLKSLSSHYLFGFRDNHGTYTEDGYLFDIAIQDDKSIADLITKTNDLKDDYFKDQEVYFMAIPRKNDYSARYFPLDLRYSDIKDELMSGLDMEFIDIYDLLDLDSYYHTDIHWRQDKIGDIAAYLVNTLNDDYQKVKGTYDTIDDFYGSLYASSFLDVKADTIAYLSFDEEGIEVYDLEKDALVGLYDLSADTHPDKYDVFLDGPSAYIRIENKNVDNGQKLIIFRDSYASSLIPLLVDSYEKIDVIDLRYFNSSLLDTLDLDKDAKVLFMYSLEFINKSGALR